MAISVFIILEECGHISEGFKITTFPAAIAVAIGDIVVTNG
jgi:hypothetical protein